MRGRPKKEESRTRVFRVRLLESEYVMLSNFSSQIGKTKSEIIRDAVQKMIEMQYDKEELQ